MCRINNGESWAIIPLFSCIFTFSFRLLMELLITTVHTLLDKRIANTCIINVSSKLLPYTDGDIIELPLFFQ